jgi:CxxC motif-containing protein (DUF1111 family)
MRVYRKIILASNFSEGAKLIAILLTLVLIQLVTVTGAEAQICGYEGCSAAGVTDPGPRGAPTGAGSFFSSSSLPPNEVAIETAMTSFIEEVNVVAGGTSTKRVGLGARWDSNGCAACHAGVSGAATGKIVPGGSSLASNPLFGVYTLMGAQNTMPTFETASGPTVVARFPYQSDLVTPDGHVHQLFVITGRTDAGTCNIQQPDFTTAASENNLIFRQTTPFFGGGLMEIIQDSAIVANMNANLSQKQQFGITGHPNYNADDGSITRFGWKAQKRSLMLFAGEAYNIEEGISNEIFPNKTDETPGCTPPFPDGPPNGNGPHGVPDDRSDFADPSTAGYLYPGDPERFGIFGRLLAPPTPVCTIGQNCSSCPGGGNCADGFTQFGSGTGAAGCVLCHTQGFTTPASSMGTALNKVPVNLFSDLLVHDMGPCDADNVTQGQATGDEFRTAPLWGVGQRFFFMHDGGMNRHSVTTPTTNIIQAIEDHACAGNSQYPNSEANASVAAFNKLTTTQQQDLVDFLRSL